MCLYPLCSGYDRGRNIYETCMLRPLVIKLEPIHGTHKHKQDKFISQKINLKQGNATKNKKKIKVTPVN